MSRESFVRFAWIVNEPRRNVRSSRLFKTNSPDPAMNYYENGKANEKCSGDVRADGGHSPRVNTLHNDILKERKKREERKRR